MDELRRKLAQYILDDIDESGGKTLGSGSYGVVATVNRQGKELAAKSFHDALNYVPGNVHNKTLKAFIEECRNSMSLSHDNIVHFYGLYFPLNSQFPSIVMELLPYCLGKVLPDGGIPSQFKPFILVDVARGLSYLHQKSIMHRDLTANNVLLTKTLQAKISDFGQAKIIQPEQLHLHTAAPGNLIYMPPEAKQGDTLQNYDYSLDVFSFGVLIIHMYLETLPQPINYLVSDARNPKVVHKIPPLDCFAHEINLCFSQEHIYRSLVCRCLEENPNRRPSTDELLNETLDIINDGQTKKSFVIVNNLKKYCAELERSIMVHERNESSLEKTLTKTIEENNALVNENNRLRQQLPCAPDGVITNDPITSISEPDVVVLEKSTQGSFVKEKQGDNKIKLDDHDKENVDVFAFDEDEDILQSMKQYTDVEETQMQKLLNEIQRLEKENKQLRDRNSDLETQLLGQSGVYQSSSYAGPAGIEVYPLPLTACSTEEQRTILKDSSTIVVSDVPQEPKSFPDIKGAQAVYLEGKVYLGRATPSIWVYDIVACKWEKLPRNAPVKNYALAIYNNELVLLGGSSNDGSVSREVLVFRNNEWCSDVIPNMIESRENGSAVGSGIYLMALGGTSTKLIGIMIANLSSIEIYVGVEKKWSKASASLPRSGCMLQCFIHDGYLYLLNPDGWTARYCNVGELIASIQKENRRKSFKIWKSLGRDLPHTRSCIFVYDNTLLAISGAGSDGAVYAYDPSSSGHWKKISCTGSLPAIQSATCLAVGHQKLFLCGGSIDIFTDLSKASFSLRVDQ